MGAATQGRPLPRRHEQGTSLAIVQPGSRSTATLISTATCHGNSPSISGYSLHGRRGKEPGGCPDFVLSGHLANVTCLVTVDGMWDNLKVGGGNDPVTGHVKFLTGGRDGMVLSWGSSVPSLCNSSPSKETVDCTRGSSSHKRQSRFRGGHDGVSTRPRSMREEPSFGDTDR